MADLDTAKQAYQIFLIGFSSHEKDTIETFFHLASHRSPHWSLTARSSEARVVLFNTASQQDMDSFKSLVAGGQKAIIVGTSDFGTGWPVMQRPLKLTAMLKVLDNFVKIEATTPPSSAQINLAASQAPKFANVTPAPFSAETFQIQDEFPAAIVAGWPHVSKPLSAASKHVEKPNLPFQIHNLNEAPSYIAPVSEVDILISQPRKNGNDVLGRVLIVDDSDIALKYMHNRLRNFGYESDMAKSGEEALAMVGNQSYKFVFLDVMMAGLDGYKTCRAIKNNKSRRGQLPVVVMLTSRGGTIDKIRGSMSGCDAYLTKPLNEKQLALVLQKYDDSTVSLRWDAVRSTAPVVDKSMLAIK